MQYCTALYCTGGKSCNTPYPLLQGNHLNSTQLNCTALNWTALPCAVQYYTALYVYILIQVLYCAVHYCSALHCTVEYCTLLDCSALHCTVEYCTLLDCSAIHLSAVQQWLQVPAPASSAPIPQLFSFRRLGLLFSTSGNLKFHYLSGNYIVWKL